MVHGFPSSQLMSEGRCAEATTSKAKKIRDTFLYPDNVREWCGAVDNGHECFALTALPEKLFWRGA